ncbi:hypothetical protein LTR94_024870, partial [Friedmanniomyces endolithicus]
MSVLTRFAALASTLSLVALTSACATHEVDYQGEGEGFVGPGAEVQARLETPSVGTAGEDAADDPAIWASSADVRINGHAAKGFVAGTDKKSGLYIYGFDGAILQFLPEGLLNNVDAVEGLSVSGRPQVVLGASDRTPGKTGVSLYRFDPAGVGDNKVQYWGAVATDVVEPYGFCFARRGEEVHAILVGHEGELRQFVLGVAADGSPTFRLVRSAEIGTISEGCAADTDSDALYINEENVGLWRYSLDPASGAERTLIQPIAKDILVADAEGLTTIADAGGRYLIGSSQGDSTFPVWKINAAAPEYKGRFKIVDGAVDGVTGTDGLAAASGVAGPFPEGLV